MFSLNCIVDVYNLYLINTFHRQAYFTRLLAQFDFQCIGCNKLVVLMKEMCEKVGLKGITLRITPTKLLVHRGSLKVNN